VISQDTQTISTAIEREGDSAPVDIAKDKWPEAVRHKLTYFGIFLFTLVLYYRPYEWVPALSGFTSIALVIAIATLLIYLPIQITQAGNLTAMPMEVKCLLLIAAWAFITIPMAKDTSLAWAKFSDQFIKVVIIFVIMVNVLTTEKRIRNLMWLGTSIGAILSFQAIELYRQGRFEVEGYRVKVDFGGMFGNPNDMSIHLVTFIPICIALGLNTNSKLSKFFYFAVSALMTAGVVVTQSRSGFLGLVAGTAVLVWKLGKGRRLKAVLVSGLAAFIGIMFVPGNYGIRLLSIVVPALDPVRSSTQRQERLIQSIWVTLRNPLGIGIGNSSLVGLQNLETHNAYTQVSSELGWIAFAIFLVFLIHPLRRLSFIQRLTHHDKKNRWLYYASVGVYASIASYMVSSFFASVSYNWYVYYPVAFAVGLQRIHISRLNLSSSELGDASNQNREGSEYRL
jgi:hypothetical protein